MPRGASAEFMRAIGTRHGLARHPLYNTYRAMMKRCYDVNHHAYGRYGGCGVKVHSEWHDVRAFIAWIESNLGPRPDGMSLDRWPDNSGDYEPGNVRWATRKEQAANKRALPKGWTPPADRSETNRRYYEANREAIFAQRHAQRQSGRL